MIRRPIRSSQKATYRRKVSSQVVYALKWLFPTLLISGGLVAALWWFFGTAEVPLTRLAGKLTPGIDLLAANFCPGNVCFASREILNAKVSVVVYLIALTTLLGWMLFAVFGGIGLVVLPIDLLMGWKMRPKPIKTNEWVTIVILPFGTCTVCPSLSHRQLPCSQESHRRKSGDYDGHEQTNFPGCQRSQSRKL